MQIVQIHLQPFRRSSLLRCVSQPEIAKHLLKPPFCKFKVINVIDTNKKLVTIVCYDKQHICAYLQAFSRYANQ